MCECGRIGFSGFHFQAGPPSLARGKLRLPYRPPGTGRTIALQNHIVARRIETWTMDLSSRIRIVMETQ